MLTNFYYYNFYRPYLIKENGRDNSVNHKPIKPKMAQQEQRKDESFMLNKALKSDVIEYAKNISSNLTSLREVTKHLSDSLKKLNKNMDDDTLETSEETIEEELESFVDAYNSAYSFASTQDSSNELLTFAHDIKQYCIDMFSDDSNPFIALKDDKLIFNKENFDSSSENYKLDYDMPDLTDFVSYVDDNTHEILKYPLTRHMNFKNLSYYYNYQVGRMDKTFLIIETGMLVDMAL